MFYAKSAREHPRRPPRLQLIYVICKRTNCCERTNCMPRTRAFEVCGGPRRDTSENIVEDTCDMEENVFYGTRASVWGGAYM